MEQSVHYDIVGNCDVIVCSDADDATDIQIPRDHGAKLSIYALEYEEYD